MLRRFYRRDCFFFLRRKLAPRATYLEGGERRDEEKQKQDERSYERCVEGKASRQQHLKECDEIQKYPIAVPLAREQFRSGNEQRHMDKRENSIAEYHRVREQKRHVSEAHSAPQPQAPPRPPRATSFTCCLASSKVAVIACADRNRHQHDGNCVKLSRQGERQKRRCYQRV